MTLQYDFEIFLQNVRKNNLIVKTILEVNFHFDIIFIQKPSWTTMRSIPSPVNSKGIPLVGVVNHPNWLTFTREPDISKEYSRVTIFINIRLASFHPSFCKDIINHRDILLALFFINNELFWIMNVYSNSSYSVIKYLKDMKINICNLLIMTVSYTSPSVQKQRPRGETTSEPYKPAFHSGHLSHNTSHDGAATLQISCLSWRRYSYST